MTLGQALAWASQLLRARSIDSPNLDADVLLVSIFKKPRAWLFAHAEKLISPRVFKKFKTLVRRRARHEPVAYIVGKKEFYGREFLVNKNVLIPRPETETLVEEALKIIPLLSPPAQKWEGLRRGSTIIDIGTGSGCIAITLAKELESIKTQKHKNTRTNRKIMIPGIFAIDLSVDALAIAKKNAKKHHATIKFLRSNLLLPLLSSPSKRGRIKTGVIAHLDPTVPQSGLWDCENLIIVANLPYLTPAEWQGTQPEIKKYEPHEALVGGRDGLRYYQKLLKQIKYYIPHLNPPPAGRGRRKEGAKSIMCLFEINPWQEKPLTHMIKKIFPNTRIEFVKDLGGLVRVCRIHYEITN